VTDVVDACFGVLQARAYGPHSHVDRERLVLVQQIPLGLDG
jgi:hypothetical protein